MTRVVQRKIQRECSTIFHFKAFLSQRERFIDIYNCVYTFEIEFFGSQKEAKKSGAISAQHRMFQHIQMTIS